MCPQIMKTKQKSYSVVPSPSPPPNTKAPFSQVDLLARNMARMSAFAARPEWIFIICPNVTLSKNYSTQQNHSQSVPCKTCRHRDMVATSLLRRSLHDLLYSIFIWAPRRRWCLQIQIYLATSYSILPKFVDSFRLPGQFCTGTAQWRNIIWGIIFMFFILLLPVICPWAVRNCFNIMPNSERIKTVRPHRISISWFGEWENGSV